MEESSACLYYKQKNKSSANLSEDFGLEGGTPSIRGPVELGKVLAEMGPSWSKQYGPVPFTTLKGGVSIAKGLELRFLCDMTCSTLRVTFQLDQESTGTHRGKPFFITAISTFALGFAGTSARSSSRRVGRLHLLHNKEIHNSIVEACQADRFTPERESLLDILDLITRYYELRPQDFGPNFLLAIKPFEFVTQNIIITKLATVAVLAGRVLSRILCLVADIKLKCLDSLVRLLPSLSQCHSAEAVGVFYDLLVQCRDVNEAKATREIVSQFQASAKSIYENQSQSYAVLAAHHPDLVEEYPMDLRYIPPVAVTSHAHHSFEEATNFLVDAPDVSTDFYFNQMAVYRIVATASLVSDGGSKLIVVYYWPIGIEYKQEPKFLGMAASNERETTFSINCQLTCHGIRVVTIPHYPQTRAGIAQRVGFRSSQGDQTLFATLHLYGANPQSIRINSAELCDRMRGERESYTRIRSETTKIILGGHIELFENAVKKLCDTRFQYMQQREAFLQLNGLSMMISSEDDPITNAEDEPPIGLPSWAIICRKLSLAIQKNRDSLQLPFLEQRGLKTIFRYITGSVVSSLRVEASRAITSLIMQSGQWQSWVTDIFLEYFASSNTKRAFRTVPKRLVLSVLQEMKIGRAHV